MSVCSGLKFSSESKLFGGGPPCPRATSATLEKPSDCDLCEEEEEAQGDSNQGDLLRENLEDSSSSVLFRIKGCQSGNQQGRSSQVAQPTHWKYKKCVFQVHNSNHLVQLTILVLHATVCGKHQLNVLKLHPVQIKKPSP